MLPPTLRRLHGMGQSLHLGDSFGGSASPVLVVTGMAQDPPLVIEDLYTYHREHTDARRAAIIEHRGARALVLRQSWLCAGYRALPGAGPLYLEGVGGGGAWRFADGQVVHVRSASVETVATGAPRLFQLGGALAVAPLAPPADF